MYNLKDPMIDPNTLNSGIRMGMQPYTGSGVTPPMSQVPLTGYSPPLNFNRPQEVVGGYEPNIDPYTGQEHFADGGEVGAYQNANPFSAYGPDIAQGVGMVHEFGGAFSDYLSGRNAPASAAPLSTAFSDPNSAVSPMKEPPRQEAPRLTGQAFWDAVEQRRAERDANRPPPTPFTLPAGVTPYTRDPNVIDISSAKDRDERAAIINPYIEQLAKARGTTPYSVVYGASTETGANLDPDQYYTVWDPIANGFIGMKGSDLRGYNFDIMPSYFEQRPDELTGLVEFALRDTTNLAPILSSIREGDPSGRTYNQLISALRTMGVELPEGYAAGGLASLLKYNAA
jgi:hypothetical protein